MPTRNEPSDWDRGAIAIVALHSDLIVLSVYVHFRRSKHFTLYHRVPCRSIRAARDMAERIWKGIEVIVINASFE